MIRTRLKYLLAELLYRLGILRWRLRQKARAGDWCVIGLHRVLPPERVARVASPPAMIMTTRVLADLLAFVRSDFEVISAETNSAALSARPRLMITIDDGWADNLEFGLPLLREYKTPASLFVVTGMIGTDRTFWSEQLYVAGEAQQDAMRARLKMDGEPLAAVIERLKRMSTTERKALLAGVVDDASPCASADRMLTWEEVSRLQGEGVTIGSHTVTHPLLTYESAEVVAQELAASRAQLDQRLGSTSRDFAYPNGDHNVDVVSTVRAQGYRRAYTTETRWASAQDDACAIPRFLLHDGAVTSPSGRFSPAIFLFTVLR